MSKDVVVDFLLKLDDKDFNASMSRMQSSVKKFLKSAAPIAAGTAILGKLGGASVSMALDFEQSFSKVSTLFGDVEVDTDNLKDKILELSSSTGIAATELNEGLYSALSAGIPVTEDMSEAIDFLTQATKLSVAGFTSVDKAVDVTTSVLNAYGLEVGEAERVMNTLIETQNAGKTTVDELASSIGKAIPAANALGVNFEELSASLAVMTANGINTAESVTAMKALLSELTDTTSLANDAFKTMTDTTIPDFIANGGSLQEVLVILNDYLDQNNGSWLDILTSSESVMAAQTLMKDGGESLAEVYARMTDDVYELNGAYEQMQTPAQNIAKIHEGLNNALIEVGEAILEKVNPALEYLADNIDTIAPKFIQASIAVGIFLVALGGMFIINTIVSIIWTFVSGIGAVASALKVASGYGRIFVQGFSSGIETMALKMLYLGDTTSLAAQTIKTSFSGISSSAFASFTSIATNFGTMVSTLPSLLSPSLSAMSSQIGTFAMTTASQFSSLALSVGGSLGGLASGIGTGLSSGFGTILASSGGFLTSLGGMFEVGFTAIAGFIGLPELAIAGLIIALIALATNAGGITDWLVEKINWLADNWDEILQRMIIAIGDFFIKLVEKAIIGLENLTVAVVNGLVNLVTTAISAFIQAAVAGIKLIGSVVVGAILTTMQSISLVVGEGFDLIFDVFESSLQFIVDLVVNTFEAIANQIKIIWDAIIEEFRIIWQSISDIFGGALDFLKALVTLDFEGMKDAIKRIWDGISNFFSDTWENIKTLFYDSLKNIYDYIVDQMNAIKDFIVNIWNNIKEFFADIWNGIIGIFQEKIDAIKGYVHDKFEAISTFFGEIGDAWEKTFGESWDNVKENTKSSIDAIKSNAKEKFSTMNDNISASMDSLNDYFSEKWETAKTIFSDTTQSIYDNTVGRFKNLVEAVGEQMDRLQAKWNDTLGAVPGIPSFNRSVEKPTAESRATRGTSAGTSSYSGSSSSSRTIPKLSKTFSFDNLSFDSPNNYAGEMVGKAIQTIGEITNLNVENVEIVSWANDFDTLMDEINENLGGLI